MRPMLLICTLVLLHAQFFCSSGRDHPDGPVVAPTDVLVEISGDVGTAFAARFEDDAGTQEASGVVPFNAEFDDQVTFFTAVLDKEGMGGEQVCIRITTPTERRESCTHAPNGRTTVTIVF